MLGTFITDPLEKAFGKLNQHVGETYFVNTRQLLEKVSINKNKLLLQLDVNENEFSLESGYLCEKYMY